MALALKFKQLFMGHHGEILAILQDGTLVHLKAATFPPSAEAFVVSDVALTDSRIIPNDGFYSGTPHG